jgi:hypothetical protein
MTESIDIQTSEYDPLLSAFELPLRATFYPLGFPLEITSNSEDILDAARESWRHFEQSFDEKPARIHLAVTKDRTEPLARPPVFRARENMMSIVADADNFVICDYRRDFAFGWVTQGVAADHARLRLHFLEAAGLTLIQHRYLAPIHGALIARNGRGVLLCGDSFAGKSTLSYACARAGWTLITDDGTYLLRNSLDRYGLGHPFTIRFREDAVEHFPEFAERTVGTRVNGKLGFEVFTQELPIRIATGSTIDHIVFLRRLDRSPAQLLPYPKQDAVRWFSKVAVVGEARSRASQRRAYERLTDAAIWEMQYRDLADAVLCLEQLVQRAI